MTKLVFTGDVMLGRLVNEFLTKSQDFSYIWGNTAEILKSFDLSFVNLECAFTRETMMGIKDSPVFFFRSEPENATVLREVGIDFCSLANNHVLDFGEEGLRQTLRTLKRAGIAFTGAGANFYQASQGTEFLKDDLKIIVFSFTDNEPGWEAGEEKAGVFYLPINLKDKRVEKFRQILKKARKEGYFVIVSAHWGPNMKRFPSKTHIKFAHGLIEAGCDVFHGHSAHVFQPVEIYKGKVILYDCGEMIDDYAVDPVLRNDESFIFEIDLEGKQIKQVVAIPILINNLRVNLAKGTFSEKIGQKMIALCIKIGTSAFWEDKRVIMKMAKGVR